MPVLRRLAVQWLEAVVRSAPPRCQEWASAMLRELDFIESDWAALRWALGSTAAISKHWLRAWLSGREEEATMKETAVKVGWVLLGVLIAAVGALGAFGVLALVFYLFPKLHTGALPVAGWVFALVLEILFVTFTVKFWRTRRPMAVGILLVALVFATHVAMHIASHWNG